MKITTTGTACAALGALAGLHALWATERGGLTRAGSSVADTVAGLPPDRAPGPVACRTVAGLLGIAALLVAGHPRRLPLLQRCGARTVVAVFGARGVGGLTGATAKLVPWTPSDRFRRLDRRYYGPLCILIAALAAPAARARPALTRR